ncbi:MULTISPECIES: Na+/H+ antiporter subunit D [Brevibacterium]|uniref:Na+/H+ antiporter subunit D n=1 Tax=Brevibacterium salitolerans TaxID=1403566 RepID=A0ABN2WP25_9MICO|nr:Na+/H+ antiporter subunit D [Brevibacterium sp.]
MSALLGQLLALPVILPLLAAAATLIFQRHPRVQLVITAVTLSLTTALSILLLIGVDYHGTQVLAVGGWALPWGIALVADRLAVLMLVVSSIVTLGVYIYAAGQEMAETEQSDDTPVSIFNPAYLILCAGVSNAFLAGDLFNLYVGFEMLLAASYVLLTLGATTARIRAGVTYIVISLVSSVLFLSAIALIYGATGTVNMAQLAGRLSELPVDIQLILHISLLLGFGVKAAVFPLSFWLPDSYPTAPAPVTAVFAGLLTKVGIYAIIRTETVLFSTSSLRVPLLIIAGLTLIVGILGAIAQSDIKRMLSFTLVSHIGYMLFGVAMGTVEGVHAAIYYTLHHIVAQTALFLAIGLIEMRGGSTSLRKLGGLSVLAPVVSIFYLIPALNLAGIPPFSGFIGKVALFDAGFHTRDWLVVVLIVAGTLTSLLTLYVIGKSWNVAFWREPAEAEDPTPALVEEAAERKTALMHGERWKPSVRMPSLMMVATAGMVVVSCMLTVLAAPLWEVSGRAAENLRGAGTYSSAVLGSDPAQGASEGRSADAGAGAGSSGEDGAAEAGEGTGPAEAAHAEGGKP